MTIMIIIFMVVSFYLGYSIGWHSAREFMADISANFILKIVRKFTPAARAEFDVARKAVVDDLDIEIAQLKAEIRKSRPWFLQ